MLPFLHGVSTRFSSFPRPRLDSKIKNLKFMAIGWPYRIDFWPGRIIDGRRVGGILSTREHKYTNAWCCAAASGARRPSGGHTQRVCPRSENAAPLAVPSHPFGTAIFSSPAVLRIRGHTLWVCPSNARLAGARKYRGHTLAYLRPRVLSYQK